MKYLEIMDQSEHNMLTLDITIYSAKALNITVYQKMCSAYTMVIYLGE